MRKKDTGANPFFSFDSTVIEATEHDVYFTIDVLHLVQCNEEKHLMDRRCLGCINVKLGGIQVKFPPDMIETKVSVGVYRLGRISRHDRYMDRRIPHMSSWKISQFGTNRESQRNGVHQTYGCPKPGENI